jgi:hypothetical protein
MIEFLELKGCANSPSVLVSLRRAISILDIQVDLRLLDIEELSRAGDSRSGYGSPTILVEGRDLLGAEPPEQAAPACRLYPSGVPTTGIIVEKLTRYS